MRPYSRTLALALFVSLCLGSFSILWAQNAPSPFAGSYAGKVTAVIADGSKQQGFADMAVENSGKWNAQLTNYTFGLTGKATGTLGSTGVFSGTINWDNGESYTLRGTLRVDANGNLRGTLNQYLGNQLVGTAELNLPRTDGN